MNPDQQPAWNRLKTGGAYPALSAAPLPGGVRPMPPVKGISHWQLAWGHKFFILTFLLLGAIGGLAYVVLTTPLFQATTTVELVGFNQSFMGMNNIDPQAGTDATTPSVSNISTQVKLLTSRTLMRRVLDRMNLEMAPSSPAPATIFTRIRNRIPFLKPEPLTESRDALRTAARTLMAKGVGTTRLIEISCMSSSPQLSANFVNTLASEYVSQTLASRSSVTQRTSEWMDSQLEESRARLQQAGEKLRDFVQKSGMDFFPEQNTLADSKLRTLQMDVAAVQTDRITKQARWEMAKNTPPDLLPDVMNDATLQNLKGQISMLRKDMAQLTTTLTPENYKVKKVQAQITETEQTLEKEKAGLLKRIQEEYEEAQRKERLLTSAYGAQTHSVSAQADKASQYAVLKRELETEQHLYDSLLQESNQASLIALAPSSSIRVVDMAGPSAIAATPKPVRDIPVFAFLGGGSGYGILWLLETARRKKRTLHFESPGHSGKILGVPELGVIPTVPVEPTKKRLDWIRAAHRDPEVVTEIQSIGISGENGHARTGSYVSPLLDRTSLLSESFRQTLVSLLRTKPEDHSPVYVITSAGPREGKTTLSVNLARAMAEIGHRVLLVDADLRRPQVHSLLGSDDHDGLSDVLTAMEEARELNPDRYIQRTDQDRLSVMTHGRARVDTPAVLFFSPALGSLIAQLQKKFDCILVDTAPALPFPDARLWGKYADGVVLVVRAGVTMREGASSACERFLNDGIPVLGTILNDWAPEDGSDAVYYSYHQPKSSPRRKASKAQP